MAFGIVGKYDGEYLPLLAYKTNAVKTVSSADYTLLSSDVYEQILVTTGSSQRTIALPTAASSPGKTITIKKVDSGSGNVSINADSSELIDGDLTQNIPSQYGAITLACDGSAWYVIGEYRHYNIKTVTTANYTILDLDVFETVLVDTGSSNRTITLPTAVNNTGRILHIKKIDSSTGNVIIDGASSETIDGDLTQTIYFQNGSAELVCDGTGWNLKAPITEYGSYTATITGVSNIAASTFNGGIFTRTGKNVQVGLAVELDPTGTTDTAVRFSLPIPSAFSSSAQGMGQGNATIAAGNANMTGMVYSNAATDDMLMEYFAPGSANRGWVVNFMYKIV